LGHKITNVPLIWKVGDIILFSWAKLIKGQFSGFSHYEFCPLKKNNLPHFPNQRYINSYT
jgi:hypothetical protein